MSLFNLFIDRISSSYELDLLNSSYSQGDLEFVTLPPHLPNVPNAEVTGLRYLSLSGSGIAGVSYRAQP